MRSLRRAAAVLWTFVEPAAWVSAAVGAAALLFPPGIAPPVPAPPGSSGGMVYGPVPHERVTAQIFRGGGYFNSPWGDVHPVVIRLGAPGPAGHVGPARLYGGGAWGAQLEVGLRLSAEPRTHVTVSLWPVALSACLVTWGVRRVRGGDPKPPGLPARLARPWVLTAAAVAAVPVLWAGRSPVMVVTTADPADGVPGLTAWHGGDGSSGRAPAVDVAGRWTGTRFGRLVDPWGRAYAFLTLRLPALAAVPLALNGVTLVRRRRRRVRPRGLERRTSETAGGAGPTERDGAFADLPGEHDVDDVDDAA